MQGILEKKEDGWYVKWSDLHSFLYGNHWWWTPLHPTEIIDEINLKDGDEVEVEFIGTDYNIEDYIPFNYVKILKKT